MESHWRTLVKTVTWRFIAISVTVVISYAWLEDFKSSMVIGIGANSIKVIAYYLHERAWNALAWGRYVWFENSESEAPTPAESGAEPMRSATVAN